MTRSLTGLVLGLMLATAGCVPAGPVPDDPAIPFDPGPDDCGASGLQGLLGQPEAVLQTLRFGQPVRIIRPGMMVTQDYMPTRLNIHIDAMGQIDRIVCG